MSYYLDMGGWSGVFAVPNSLVDKHLKLSGEHQIKVLLWALRHGGELFSAADVSAGTGVPVPAVEEAVDYWMQLEVLAASGNNLVQGNETSSHPVQDTPVSHEAESKPKKLTTVVDRKMLRPDGVFIAQRIKEDPGVAHMMQEAESLLGKTVSPSLAAVLINAHDDYALPPEVVTVIISYAKSIGKTNTAYIEALAKNWAESGIYTLEDAEKKLTELSRHSMAWKKVASLLGIPTRAATKKEDEFSYKWIYELDLSNELIHEAYERCVNNIGKLQFKYMDTCLENWAAMGFRTALDVYEHEEKLRQEKSTASRPSYDIDELESFNVYTDWKKN